MLYCRDILDSDSPAIRSAILDEASLYLQNDVLGIGGLSADHIQRLQKEEAKEMGSLVRIGRQVL